MPLLRTLATVSTAAIAVLIAFASCSDPDTPQPCTDIPAGGCPLSHGVACSDPECSALYACRANNVWEIVQQCPPHDASTPDANGGDAEDAAETSSSSFDASIDAPPGAFGGPGCDLLQPPDCSLGFALSCSQSTQTCCDCEDLFICENGGWTLWGACGDAGPIQR